MFLFFGLLGLLSPLTQSSTAVASIYLYFRLVNVFPSLLTFPQRILEDLFILPQPFILSLFVLIVGYNYVLSLYKFSSSKKIKDSKNISVMNYNVKCNSLPQSHNNIVIEIQYSLLNI